MVASERQRVVTERRVRELEEQLEAARTDARASMAASASKQQRPSVPKAAAAPVHGGEGRLRDEQAARERAERDRDTLRAQVAQPPTSSFSPALRTISRRPLPPVLDLLATTLLTPDGDPPPPSPLTPPPFFQVNEALALLERQADLSRDDLPPLHDADGELATLRLGASAAARSVVFGIVFV